MRGNSNRYLLAAVILGSVFLITETGIAAAPFIDSELQPYMVDARLQPDGDGTQAPRQSGRLSQLR